MAIEQTSVYVPGIYRGGDKADDVRRYVEDELAQVSRFLGETTDLDLRPLFYSDAAGATGVSVSSYHDSPSPAAGDVVLEINAKGNNNAGEQVVYAQLSARITSAANGSESGFLAGQAMLDGTLSDTLLGEETFLLGCLTSPGFFEYVWRGPPGYSAQFYLESADNGNLGMELHFWHDSDNPAASDDVGILYFDGRDSAGNYQQYGVWKGGHIVNATAGSEENLMQWTNIQSGDTFLMDNGLRIGNPGGSFTKGIGTITAVGLYDDGVLVTPYVFEAAETGNINFEALDQKVANVVIPATPQR